MGGDPFVSELKSSALIIKGVLKYLHLSKNPELWEPFGFLFAADDEQFDFAERAASPVWKCTADFDEAGESGLGDWLCLLVVRDGPEKPKFGGPSERFLFLPLVDDPSEIKTSRRAGCGSVQLPKGKAESI